MFPMYNALLLNFYHMSLSDRPGDVGELTEGEEIAPKGVSILEPVLEHEFISVGQFYWDGKSSDVFRYEGCSKEIGEDGCWEVNYHMYTSFDPKSGRLLRSGSWDNIPTPLFLVETPVGLNNVEAQRDLDEALGLPERNKLRADLKAMWDGVPRNPGVSQDPPREQREAQVLTRKEREQDVC